MDGCKDRCESARILPGDVVADGNLVHPPARIAAQPFGDGREGAARPRATADERTAGRSCGTVSHPEGLQEARRRMRSRTPPGRGSRRRRWPRRLTEKPTPARTLMPSRDRVPRAASARAASRGAVTAQRALPLHQGHRRRQRLPQVIPRHAAVPVTGRSPSLRPRRRPGRRPPLSRDRRPPPLPRWRDGRAARPPPRPGSGC